MDTPEHLQVAIHDLAETQDPGRIERVEQEGGSVRYRNVLMLAPGVWSDAGSGRRIFYSSDGIANSADNWSETTVNLFHERENEVTDVGDVDTESLFLGEADGGLYGDIVLHMDNPASRFADEALQNALETGGQEGLQGPSVELRGEEYTFNEARGAHELVEGTFLGLGLVGLGVSPGPGSKDAAFAEQTRERAVALAGDGDADLLTLQHHETESMNREDQLALLAEHGIDLDDDVDDETVQTLLAALELQEDEDDGDGEDEEGDESDDDSDGDDDGDEMDLSDVAARVDGLADQVEMNAERIEAIAEATEALQDGEVDLAELSDSVAEVDESLETLADAEAVSDLEERLAAIEDEPEDPASLADGTDEPPASDDGERILSEMGSGNPNKPTFTR